MALKDMKSDLSKFRMPKKEPLESKKREDIKSNQNQTPLSSMIDSAPKIPRSQTTTNKEGVNPQKVDQSEKFKGETNPTPMDNKSKFLGETTPTPMSLEERYLGQTDPKKMDNSEKFLGETTPTSENSTGQFLGETNPSKMDNSEKFLGETDPTPSNNESNFLGETNPTPMDNSEKFLGETNPTPMDNSENFLGETTPTSAEPKSKFLGETTPTPMSLEERFLGETTPNEVNQNEKFKGETNPNKFDNTSNFVRFSNEQISSPYATEPNQMNLDAKFLGETDTKPMSLEERFLGETTPTDKDSTGQFLGETTPTKVEQGDKFKGETEPTVMSLGDKFKGETTPGRFPYILRQENEGKDPGEVNYIQDIHATGFTSKFESKDQSKFIGVNPDNTQFDTTTSLYGRFGDSFNGLSFTPGYGKFKVGKETGNTPRYNPDSKYLVDTELTNKSISKLQEMRSSPSFLDEMYNKYNLRDDAFNLGTAAFAHPLILRGIQRKGIDKGEPQKWGFGFPVDDGLVRGGIVTAVDRAVVDAVRLGKWMISVQGLLWGIKNLGLQASNSNVETLTGKRLTKVWTPINTIASTLGGFIGLHPRRHGILPLPESANPEKYETVQKGKRVTHVADPALAAPITGNRLVGLWAESFITIGDIAKSSTFNGLPFARLQSLGGPNSLYGLIPGGRVPTRNENTRPNDFIGYTIFNQYATFRLESDGSRVAEGNTRALDVLNLGTSEDNFGDKTELGKKIQPYQTFTPTKKPTSDPNDTANKKVGITHNDEYTYEKNRSSDVQGSDYEGNDLGLIWEAYTTKGRPSDGALNRGVTHTSKDNPFDPIPRQETSDPNDERNRIAGTLNTPDLPYQKNSPKLSRDVSEVTDGYREFQNYKTPNVNQFNGGGKNALLGYDALITNYETIAYGDIPKRVAGDTQINDFRKKLTGAQKDLAEDKNTDYATKSLSRIGFASHIPGRDLTNVSNGVSADTVTSAALNTTQNDLVNFWIKADGGKKTQFRGTVSGITETFSPSWDSFKYNGRADQAYKYTTFERSLSLNFKAYATSRSDMVPMYQKLMYLSTMTMPVYGSGGYHGTLVTFRLGDLYNGKLAFIESLTYTMSDETPWDINIDGQLGEVPMGVDISIGFKILDGVRPQLNQNIWDWGKIALPQPKSPPKAKAAALDTKKDEGDEQAKEMINKPIEPGTPAATRTGRKITTNDSNSSVRNNASVMAGATNRPFGPLPSEL